MRDQVTVCCSNCNVTRTVIYRELIRTVNNQARFAENYHCPSCYRSLPNVRDAASIKSTSVVDKITIGASERSKRLWTDPAYQAKCRAAATALKQSPRFAEKISKALKLKFAGDQEYVARINASRYNQAGDFWRRCAEQHDDLYDYSSSVYRGVDVPTTIHCKTHGDFLQLPSNHVKGHGCPQCATDASRLTPDEFFERCAVVHNNKFDYDFDTYVGSLSHITYRCPTHGPMRQLAQNHLKGRGCRYCSQNQQSSRGEDDLANFVASIVGEVERHNRTVLAGNEIDIFIPAHRLGLEYHGLYWHSYNRQESTQERFAHHRKATMANAAGILLLQVFESEWLLSRAIVCSIIQAKLGLSERIQARKCQLVSLSQQQAADFCRTTHLQGHRSASACFGLIHAGDIVACATFIERSTEIELIRFCSAIGKRVVGGLSKLLSGMRGRSKPIFTYADRRYSNATAYHTVGFSDRGITGPGYHYCRGTTMFSRQHFQKHKLARRLATFDPSLTEAQNMFANGYRRIWDAGHIRSELI